MHRFGFLLLIVHFSLSVFGNYEAHFQALNEATTFDEYRAAFSVARHSDDGLRAIVSSAPHFLELYPILPGQIASLVQSLNYPPFERALLEAASTRRHVVAVLRGINQNSISRRAGYVFDFAERFHRLPVEANATRAYYQFIDGEPAPRHFESDLLRSLSPGTFFRLVNSPGWDDGLIQNLSLRAVNHLVNLMTQETHVRMAEEWLDLTQLLRRIDDTHAEYLGTSLIAATFNPRHNYAMEIFRALRDSGTLHQILQRNLEHLAELNWPRNFGAQEQYDRWVERIPYDGFREQLIEEKLARSSNMEDYADWAELAGRVHPDAILLTLPRFFEHSPTHSWILAVAPTVPREGRSRFYTLALDPSLGFEAWFRRAEQLLRDRRRDETFIHRGMNENLPAVLNATATEDLLTLQNESVLSNKTSDLFQILDPEGKAILVENILSRVSGIGDWMKVLNEFGEGASREVKLAIARGVYRAFPNFLQQNVLLAKDINFLLWRSGLQFTRNQLEGMLELALKAMEHDLGRNQLRLLPWIQRSHAHQTRLFALYRAHPSTFPFGLGPCSDFVARVFTAR